MDIPRKPSAVSASSAPLREPSNIVEYTGNMLRLLGHNMPPIEEAAE